MILYRGNRVHLSDKHDAGFVLPTALLLLTLLTMLATTMYFVSRSSTVTSAAANSSTVAVYYAETAIHYMSWAFAANDAEFDSFTYTGTYVRAPAAEPLVPAGANTIGDKLELINYLWDPGPTGAAGSLASDNAAPTYNSGQVMYFDNSAMASRHLCLESAALFPNCVDITLKKKNRTEPLMYQISAHLPRYIKLDITAGDSSTNPVTPPAIVVSIPSLPHRNPPVINEDVPRNGAVVWLTAADPANSDHDIEIFPLDPVGVYNGISPSACTGGVLPNCPCTAPSPLSNQNDPNYASFMAAQACDANTGQWLSNYNIVAYAIAYVNGKPSHMLRAIIR